MGSRGSTPHLQTSGCALGQSSAQRETAPPTRWRNGTSRLLARSGAVREVSRAAGPRPRPLVPKPAPSYVPPLQSWLAKPGLHRGCEAPPAGPDSTFANDCIQTSLGARNVLVYLKQTASTVVLAANVRQTSHTKPLQITCRGARPVVGEVPPQHWSLQDGGRLSARRQRRLSGFVSSTADCCRASPGGCEASSA